MRGVRVLAVGCVLLSLVACGSGGSTSSDSTPDVVTTTTEALTDATHPKLVSFGPAQFAVTGTQDLHVLDGGRACLAEAADDPEILEFFCPFVAVGDGFTEWTAVSVGDLCRMDGTVDVTATEMVEAPSRLDVAGVTGEHRRLQVTCSDGTSTPVDQWLVASPPVQLTAWGDAASTQVRERLRLSRPVR